MQPKRLKILGLSLLALAGIMTVSASAAQANWQLLLNGGVVTSLNWAATAGAGELLVPAIGLAIRTGGTGTITALGGGTTVSKGRSRSNSLTVAS
jgi:hypothetical protein